VSPLFRRGPADHDRARELAALRVDEPLEPADGAWLDAHLAVCDACAAAAADYDTDRLLFSALRAAPPEPPRDLWARTAAAIDAEPGQRHAVARPGRRVLGMPAASLAPIAGLAVVAILVGSALLNGSPVVPPPAGSPAPTAIAVTTDDIAVLARNADGSFEVRTAGLDEVCPLAADTCEVAEPSFEAAQVARISTGDKVDDAIISPARDSMVIVGRDASGTNGLYVVPVRPAAAVTRTPTPAPEPTDTPTVEPSPAVTPTPALTSTPSSATASPAATPAPSASVPPEATPAATSTEAPASAPASTEPNATPQATPEPSTEPTPTPEPTLVVTVTPSPDGTIQIASDVIVVGGVAAYNADGSRFAFTARPADGSAGPDVYVWNTSDTQARAVTTDGRSVLAGWDGPDLLVSRVVDGRAHTLAVNPRTGREKGEHGRDAWLPSVAPDGRNAVWWTGSVRLAPDGVTWVPGEGRLVIGSWPDGADDAQVLELGAGTAWDVRWAPDGTAVATWIAGEEAGDAGRLSLYALDPESGRASLDTPLLENERAFAGFSLENGRLVYTAPGADGARPVWVFGWDGETRGKIQLQGEAGGTVVR
jgi:hypothetical protein